MGSLLNDEIRRTMGSFSAWELYRFVLLLLHYRLPPSLIPPLHPSDTAHLCPTACQGPRRSSGMRQLCWGQGCGITRVIIACLYILNAYSTLHILLFWSGSTTKQQIKHEKLEAPPFMEVIVKLWCIRVYVLIILTHDCRLFQRSSKTCLRLPTSHERAGYSTP